MSTISKVTLGASITFAVGMITYVHYWQQKEREVFFTLIRGGEGIVCFLMGNLT